MGAVIPKGKKKNKEEKRNLEYDDQKYIKDQGYEEDTIDSANLALAINKGDFTSNVLIRFSCENLPKMDTLSQSDPIIAVYQTIDDKKDFVGLTECIPDNCNPKFSKSFIFSYNVSNIQNPITCDIFDVMLTANQTISRDIYDIRKKKKKCGSLTIRGQEYDVSGKKVIFELGGRDIASKHELYLIVSSIKDGKDYPVYASQPEKKSKKQIINWKKFQIPLSYFGENSKSYVKLEVFEYYKEKGHVLIGDIETTIQHLIDNSGKSVNILMNQLKVGELKLHNVKLDHRVSFLNYLLADAEVSLIVAVDFTHSNKDQNDPSSLHYTHTEKNTYYQALNNLVGILQYFDADNRIPLYGFGAKLPPYYNIVSHGFAMNENIFDPYINGGSDNLIRVYKQKAPTLKMHGPTVFSEVIKLGKTWAEKETEKKNYYVLLIVTDGINNDEENTLDEIVEASEYPLTIIIVGIGDEDFTQLKELLEPQKPNKYLYSKKLGKQAIRNNVHFFVYKDYNKNMQTLARECMRKLPRQFIEYMEMKNMKVPPQDKNMKEATEAYMHKKMDQKKNAFKKKKKYQLKQNLQDDWLVQLKEEFIKKLVYLNYEPYYVDKIIKQEINQTDLIMEQQKKESMKSQQQFIKAIQNKQTDDQKEQQIRLQKQIFLEKKYHQYLKKVYKQQQFKKNQESYKNKEKFNILASSQFNIDLKIAENKGSVDVFIPKGDNLFFKGDYDNTDEENEEEDLYYNNKSGQNFSLKEQNKQNYYISNSKINALQSVKISQQLLSSTLKFQSQNNSPAKQTSVEHKKSNSQNQFTDFQKSYIFNYQTNNNIQNIQQFRRYQLGTGKLIQQTKEKLKKKKEKEENSYFYFNSSDDEDKHIFIPQDLQKIRQSQDEKKISLQQNSYSKFPALKRDSNEENNYINFPKQSKFSHFKNNSLLSKNKSTISDINNPIQVQETVQNYSSNQDDSDISDFDKQVFENSLEIDVSDNSKENSVDAEINKIEKILDYKDFVQIIQKDDNYFNNQSFLESPIKKNNQNQNNLNNFINYGQKSKIQLNKKQENLLRKKMQQQISNKKESSVDSNLNDYNDQKQKHFEQKNSLENKQKEQKDIIQNLFGQNISNQKNKQENLSFQSEQQWIFQQQQEELKRQEDRLKEEKSKKLIYQNDLNVFKIKQNRCLVCHGNQANVVLQPCGDIGFCKNCFEQNQNNECCICGVKFNRKKSMVVVDDKDYYNEIFG
ncbi:C2 domain [Pseudocohnilembus persalinus]|uniref:C2 domain n=1 Tax=Pseudocohnilembus persalinus TaxID=266149 RepID=A0A0V0QR43_PSEPJ|nr:C2 domain [Pseudocohnilembus persalinus]|eukprot:KRX04637.1 C2 domain [Pseudocohnilembus persalinus]